jgi:Fe2+ or Zn2+ uptake regulation protein
VLVPTKGSTAAEQEQKQAEILRVLESEPEGLTYSDLFTQVEETMSLATMKRNLLILERNGQIRKNDGLYFGS